MANEKHIHDFVLVTETWSKQHEAGTDRKIWKYERNHKCSTCFEPMTSISTDYAIDPPSWWSSGGKETASKQSRKS